MVSVCPKPSRIVTPQAFSTCAITSGFSGSPAPTTLVGGVAREARSDWISIRHTVGGAQKLVTPTRPITSSSDAGSKRAVLWMKIVASAIHGANTLDHACFAQPGEEMLRCTSPGSRPIQYIVDR